MYAERQKLIRKLSQISVGERSYSVNASIEASAEGRDHSPPFDIEATFLAQYDRIARVIGRVVRDPARAEELAVEAFLKLWRTRSAHGDNWQGWLYRVAVRLGLDELRRETRRSRYDRFLGFHRVVPTPEEILASSEEQDRVRLVLGFMNRRQAEMLLLRSDDFSYEELAVALDIHAASVGTLLSRAQQAFRKEYVKRYGEQQ